ncbi:sensor histidine kinase [Actinopolymorpha pittospori]|uniref:histidine kinase n=1 Tax=Actinopolymorpha pittospori TaxID=648752 RepID=A0A927MRP0_9ACTN|nr:signal transduction histidine kinase [Actinopolymorpha pittospori]
MTTPPVGPGSAPASRRSAAPERGPIECDPAGAGEAWWHGWHSWPVKLPLVLAVVQVFGTLGAARHLGAAPEPVAPLAIVLLVAGPAALVFRHHRIVAVLCFLMALTLAYLGLGYPLGPFVFSPIIALIEAVRQRHRLVAWVSAGVLYFGHLAIGWLSGADAGPSLVKAVIVAGWLLVVLIGAELTRIRVERVEESRRARAAEAAGRVTEERLRIARELHDVVAHNISLINVQAGVALHLMDAQPEQARTALTAIKQASKETLVELRSVLGVLRQVDESGPRHPAPSLRRLDDLAARTRQAGLDVRVSVGGRPVPLPSSVDTAAYRIVQEALTNVLRHSGARTAWVRVDYGGRMLVVEVVDDGLAVASGLPNANPNDGSTGGSGLAGMRERVTALGGDLVVGPVPGKGFRVYAELPQEGAP